MNKNIFPSVAAVTAFAVAVLSGACSNPQSSVTETVSCNDSSQYVRFSMKCEIPVVTSPADAAIRDSIISRAVLELERFGSFEQPHRLPEFEGDSNDMKALISFYGHETFLYLESLAQEDMQERIGYTMFLPAWEYTADVRKISESASYVVYESRNYIYMGGAHGGVTGEGQMTFRKSDGRLIESFIRPGSELELQDALKEGLLSYYSQYEDGLSSYGDIRPRLFLDTDSIIPLPMWAPYPSGDGLVFTYQQYEIAPYSDGMPSFTVPYKTVRRYMTKEAKRITGK